MREKYIERVVTIHFVYIYSTIHKKTYSFWEEYYRDLRNTACKVAKE